MASLTYSIPIRTSSDKLWALVCDVRRVAQLFPFTIVDEYHSPEPCNWVFRRRVNIPNVTDLTWREHSWTEREGELHFRAVDGDLQTFNGHWQVAANDTGATLTLALEYVIPEALRPRVPSAMVDYVMGELCKTICLRMKEAVEEAPV